MCLVVVMTVVHLEVYSEVIESVWECMVFVTVVLVVCNDVEALQL